MLVFHFGSFFFLLSSLILYSEFLDHVCILTYELFSYAGMGITPGMVPATVSGQGGPSLQMARSPSEVLFVIHIIKILIVIA
ncbi:hypothetical protein BJY52DRAFT_1241881 [Lactarius psammicola]|nr:hypothetical protein BJY52DRAFT_1241881 [Lactarius psammicola]